MQHRIRNQPTPKAAGLLIPLLLALFLVTPPAQARVRVGVYQNEPKVFRDDQGQAKGFFIDLLKAVARREGWSLQFVRCQWQQCLQMLADNRIDLMPDVAYSPQRGRRFVFGREVALSSWSLFYTKPGRPLYSLKALNGKKVAVVAGSIQYQALEKKAAELGIQPTFIELNTMADVFRKVQAGKAVAGLVNAYFGRRNAERFGLKASSVLIRPTLLYFAASQKGSKLLPTIDNYLRAWKQDRDSLYHQAMERWLSPDDTRHIPTWLYWLGVAVVLLSLVLLLLVVLFRIMLKRKTAELEHQRLHLDHLAHHDILTGLANRLLFFDRLEASIRRARRNKSSLALLFLDLHQFKQINDSHGHTLGDLFLQQVARRLENAMRASDSVARIGGDEFAVILEEVKSPEDVLAGARRIQSLFEKPIQVSGHQFSTSFSIGIALYPQDGEDPHTLLRNADTAMFRAKAAGRGGYQFYELDMTRDAIAKERLETALRESVSQKAFEVHYQPLVRLRDSRLAGFEALLRWRHPTLGKISPERFLPLAEELGLISGLGDQVLQQVCDQVTSWRDAGLEPGRVAVNLAGEQLRNPDLPAKVNQALAEGRCPPQSLEFEVTENFLMHTADRSLEILRQLRNIGLELAIDDFGTGYSSLAYLKLLPISRLKIDRTLVTGLPEDENDRAITRAVIAMGHALGLKVLAEGVETEAQRRFLQEEGCDEAQGFLFGQAMPATAATEMLEKQRAEPNQTA